MTTANVTIGYFPRTTGCANLVFSGLCGMFVPHFVAHMLKTLNLPHFCGTSVAQAEIDRSPYTRCLPNHAHTHATRTQISTRKQLKVSGGNQKTPNKTT